MNPQDELQQKIKERLAELPTPVRDAITSSDVQASLRTLSDSQKLHLDQWQMFENEVFLALLGFQRAEDLEQNIITHVKTTPETARQLAVDVNAVVFEPIRKKLEQQLEHPGVKTQGAAATTTGEHAPGIPAQPITPEQPQTEPPLPVSPPVQPATPPPPAPDIKVTRPSESTAYRPGEASTARKEIADDPYREPLA